MCAVATFVALALVATPVIFFLSAVTNGKFDKHATLARQNISDNNNITNFSQPDNAQIQFLLFTRHQFQFPLKINDLNNYKRSGLNISNPTKIVIHGFQSSINEDVFIANKNAYLESGDYNVIGMDWSVLCEFEYLSALKGVRKAGSVLATFLNWLARNGVELNQVHLIGHSLGAHIAGIAGNKVKNGQVGRITGLDPAAPGFREANHVFKLDSNDAKIVDVVHTYMEVLSIAQPVGHIDFYPNGGRWQPGCPDIYDIWQVTESLVCNHARAYEFFAESIRNKRAFRSKRCNSVEDALYSRCFQTTNVYMGQVETYGFGLYYVHTKNHSPYSLPDL